MELRGSKTEKNLLTAFAGESQARNRYTYFASKAKKEGFVQISAIFEETADQEKEHAKRLFKFLEGGEVEITAAFPAGVIGNTVDNLRASAAGENYEHTEMYPGFAKTAREEEGIVALGADLAQRLDGPSGDARGLYQYITGLISGLTGEVVDDVHLRDVGRGTLHDQPRSGQRQQHDHRLMDLSAIVDTTSSEDHNSALRHLEPPWPTCR